MDDRFGKINKLLIAYSVGNFDKKLAMSKRMDEVDAFIAGVNMLGEELKEKTISRNYFNNIFNSVSDMVFVLGKQGRIENINQSVTDLLQYNLKTLAGKHISYLFDKLQPGWFASVLKDLRISGAGSYETVFRTNNKNRIPVLVSASIFLGRQEDKTKILLTAKDISLQKKTQNLILKAIIETEENERMRFAKDIHDSIGQQLSAIKFYIGTSVDAVENPHQKSILLKADRSTITASRNDLSYVTVEIVDDKNNLVPNANIPVEFSISGAGELAAAGSANPSEMASFHQPKRNTFRGKCLVILRPKGEAGEITLEAKSPGLQSAKIVVVTEK